MALPVWVALHLGVVWCLIIEQRLTVPVFPVVALCAGLGMWDLGVRLMGPLHGWNGYRTRQALEAAAAGAAPDRTGN